MEGKLKIMIKTVEVNVPIQVEYEIHKGEAATNTHDQIEILNMCVHNVKIPWEIEKELSSSCQDDIENQCFDK
ncbi:hypothetical protein J7M07_01705 [bacterium]|nr:hypothetical protein [bacterium]